VEQRVTCTVREDGVADVRLDRADKMNALDRPMFAALVETGTRLAEDPSVRAVVLSGNGRAFCAGLDFGAFRGMVESTDGTDGTDGAGRLLEPEQDENPTWADAYDGPAQALGQRAAYVWAELPVPVIAAVHGVAFGGGLQVALGADIRLVADDARLSVMEIKWGLAPDMTGTQLLPELVGRDVAKELTFTGREVTGAEAVRLGLATRVEAEPRAAALELAARIAAKSPDAVRYSKSLLDQAGRVTLAEGFAAEQTAIRALIGSANQREAVTANLAGRAPSFTDPGPA
jgi:enoyl-CoA hydratase/carnithine racemase